MKEIILAYQGEMTLKGLNRGKFEARLSKIIRWRLEPLGKFKVYQAQSTVFIEPKEEGLDMDEAFRRVSHVFGIVKMSRAVECPKDFDAICETAEAYLGETLRGIRTFKVEAKRADKTYPMKSPEICRELGAYLLDKHHHLRVDVHNPQLEVMVEIRDHSAYVHGPKVEAAGGLPVGTSGRALNLLTGGIDSPVAAWCMARRGLALHQGTNGTLIVIADGGKAFCISCQQHQRILPGGEHGFSNAGKTKQHHAINVAASEHAEMFFNQLGRELAFHHEWIVALFIKGGQHGLHGEIF